MRAGTAITMRTTTHMTMVGTITTTTDRPAFLPLPLMAWLSPSFPIGGFAYSHGLEAAVESGDIHDAASCATWLADLVDAGSIRSDCVLLSLAYRAEDKGQLNELALALAPSSERRLETASQGTAFAVAVAAAWPALAIDDFLRQAGIDETALPVAVGVAAAAHELPLAATLGAFALSSVSNLVSAVLRLGPIGQTEAQRIIATLCPALDRLAAWAVTSTRADLGSVGWRADIASMRHETQYSRLFRS
jgi:urease accessory protein